MGGVEPVLGPRPARFDKSGEKIGENPPRPRASRVDEPICAMRPLRGFLSHGGGPTSKIYMTAGVRGRSLKAEEETILRRY